MLLRVDVPGLSFEDLDLRFDPSSGSLSYRPEPMQGLMSWNRDTLRDDCDHDEMDALQRCHGLLLACYADWRLHGGRAIAAVEASLATRQAVSIVQQEPRWSSLRRLGKRAQSWLGLLDVHEV